MEARCKNLYIGYSYVEECRNRNGEERNRWGGDTECENRLLSLTVKEKKKRVRENMERSHLVEFAEYSNCMECSSILSIWLSIYCDDEWKRSPAKREGAIRAI
jgi:hypothetical protein